MKHNFLIFLKKCRIAAGIFLFASCASQISGVLREDGSAGLTVKKSDLQPSIIALAGSISQNALLFDAKSLEKSIAGAAGVKSASLKNITPSSIAGTIEIAQVNGFLSFPDLSSQKFIAYEQSGSGGKIALSLDRTSAPRLVSFLSPELESYLSFLMAPAFLENNRYITSKTEYIEELKKFYKTLYSGRSKKSGNNKLIDDFATEIETAELVLVIDFPKNIESVQKGSFSGRRAEFIIPLIDLLVLETPLKYEVTWK